MRTTNPELLHPDYRGVHLSKADAPDCLALSTEAGWNQLGSDWLFMLGEGLGFGFETKGSGLVASAILMPYGNRFAWISMVLVSATARRQGLATLLLRHALEVGRQRQEQLLLDATDDGRKVYLQLGFRDLRAITRWVCGPRVAWDAPLPPEITRLATTDAWADWDEVRFGASRSKLLRDLHAAGSAHSWQSGFANATHAGFCLARPGRVATQLGPLVATDETVAAALLSAALSRAAGAFVVDVVDGRQTIEALLRQRGFVPSRRFTRMIQGSGPEPGRPAEIFAIAGPEFG